MKLRSIVAPLVVAGLTIAIAGSACGGNAAKEVAVSLDQYSVAPAVGEIRAGKVVFVVTNDGDEPHEFLVIRTDLPAHLLPVEDGKVPEDEVNLIDEIEPFAPGETQRLILTLQPGKYVFICNIAEFPPDQPIKSHYEEGMAVALLVTE